MSIGATVSTDLLDNLITPAVLAARLGISERTLCEKRVTGSGPAYIRIGKSVRYRPEAVDFWLLSREVSGTSEERRR